MDENRLGACLTLATVEVEYQHSVTYHKPIETRKKTALARVLTRSIDATQQGLLWITAYNRESFPQRRTGALFDGYRKSLGENRAIREYREGKRVN